MNNFSKNKFIFIIDNYHEYMNFHELINLYFKILDNIYPNYIHKINNKDVYNRLYSKRNITKIQCCSKHSSLKNIQYIFKKKLISTDYEKKNIKRLLNFLIILIVN